MERSAGRIDRRGFARGVGALALMGGLGACGDGSIERALEGEAFGTSWSATLFAPEEAEAADLDRARALIDAVVARVDEAMSTWRDDSEISRFNASPEVDRWLPVSADFAQVAERARAIAALSGGAFDPTVAPLVRLWGFARDERGRDAAPEPEAIEALQGVIGHARFEARRDPPALKKSHPGVTLDLSAIAKGYAVDRVGDALEKAGARAQLVEIGGEVRVRGAKSSGPWRVGVEEPDPSGRSVRRVIALEDEAIATSGDYRAFFESDGRRYSHLIDPRSGAPIAHRAASATVIAADCMSADALATAFMIMGGEAGLELANKENIALFMIERRENGDAAMASKAFSPYLTVGGD